MKTSDKCFSSQAERQCDLRAWVHHGTFEASQIGGHRLGQSAYISHRSSSQQDNIKHYGTPRASPPTPPEAAHISFDPSSPE